MFNDPANDAADHRFIMNWHRYEGIGGYTRHVLPFLLLGLLLSPGVLLWINPGIVQQMQTRHLADFLLPLLSLIAVFALLPAFAIGSSLWWRKHRRFMRLTTADARYLRFEERLWQPNEKRWRSAISMMAALAGLSAILALGLLLGQDVPEHHTYPFLASVVFLAFHAAYHVFMQWWSGRQDDKLYVPFFFKVLLPCSFVSLVMAWIVFFSL